MVSTQRNGGASVIAHGIDVTPTPPTPQMKKTSNRWRHNDKYLFVSINVLSYSIHIQLFSQNQSLLSQI